MTVECISSGGRVRDGLSGSPKVAIVTGASSGIGLVGLEKQRPNNEEEVPVVLLHGTSGQSEDWSQVVEQLTKHRPVIRLDYAEPVAGTDSVDAPRVSDFADRVGAAAGAGGRHLFSLVGFSLRGAAATFIWAGVSMVVRSVVLGSGVP